MYFKTHVELDNEGKLTVSGWAEFANISFIPALLMCWYVTPLSIALSNIDYLSDSTMVKIFSYFFGVFAGVIGGISGLVAAFIIPYRYDFARDVFNVITNNDFRISMSLITLLIPVARLSTRIIKRIVKSYRYRSHLFVIIVIINFASIFYIIQYLSTIENSSAYVFSYIVNSIVFIFLVAHNNESQNPRIRPRINPFDNGSLDFNEYQ